MTVLALTVVALNELIYAGVAQTIAPYFLGAALVVTYLLELWTGFAVIGWQGQNALIDRREKPGPYWFAMALQTLLFLAVPILVASFR